ncbi:hypothetical protein FUMI01_04460 [Flavobacterium sp. UMI-01]|nr:hypothetical protein FUMI01_04460 [Flavobacterium sp. UMI-01]
MVLIPVKLNGVPLTFLLDTGVGQTIVFSVDESNNSQYKNVEKIRLKGFGSDYTALGLKSTDNVLEIKGMQSQSHLLYVILGGEFNFSDHLGVPVNGIIGHSFFKNHLVEINYAKKRITLYKDTPKNTKRVFRKFTQLPLIIEKDKPYVMGNVTINNRSIPVKLLLDVGNSDSVWLFENDKIKIPTKNFDDYLGKGFSGDAYGKRAKIEAFQLDNFTFKRPIVAFPDSTTIQYLKFVPGRMGSVGGEILKRFSVMIDYKNSNLYLKPNGMFANPFLYNKSGIEVIHAGMKFVNIQVNQKALLMKTASQFDSDKPGELTDFKYKFELKPIFKVASVRVNSPAAQSGIKEGDVIVSINKHNADSYSYQELLAILKSDEEKWITMEVIRKGEILTFKFKLVSILE